MATKKVNQKSKVEETKNEECKCTKCNHSKENFTTGLSNLIDEYNTYLSEEDIAQVLVNVACNYSIDYNLLECVVLDLQDNLVEVIGDNLQVIPIITELLDYLEES